MQYVCSAVSIPSHILHHIILITSWTIFRLAEVYSIRHFVSYMMVGIWHSDHRTVPSQSQLGRRPQILKKLPLSHVDETRQCDYWNHIKPHINGWNICLCYALFQLIFSFHIILYFVREYFYFFCSVFHFLPHSLSDAPALFAFSVTPNKFCYRFCSDFDWLISLSLSPFYSQIRKGFFIYTHA